MLPINYLAILVAALANFILGFIFHSPPIGNVWMKLANIKPTGKEKMSDMIPQMIKNLLVNVVFSFGLAALYAFVSTSSLAGAGILTGILCGAGVWMFGLFPTTAVDVIWMGKSYKLWLYELFCSLVAVVAMGAIIGAWA